MALLPVLAMLAVAAILIGAGVSMRTSYPITSGYEIPIIGGILFAVFAIALAASDKGA